MPAASSRRRRPVPEEEHENHERWLVTYADMLTLLMVLFIVLFAISTVDQKKFNAFGAGLAKAFGNQMKVIQGSSGVLSGGSVPASHLQVAEHGSIAVIPPPQLAPGLARATSSASAATAPLATRQELDRFAAARRAILAALHRRGLDSAVRFQLEQRGLDVSIVTDRVLFAPGQTTLEPVGQQILDAVAPALQKLPNDIAVEGHTDNTPLHGAGPIATNWELSALRATSVLRYLSDIGGVPAARLSASGYADERPVVPNDNAADRTRNRRVEIVVLTAHAAAGATTATPTNPTTPAMG